MNRILAKHTKRLVFLLLCCILCSQQGKTAAYAAVVIDGCRIEDGFTPPEDETIVYYLNNSSKAYTLVANKVQELWVGEHHRFTVAANKREKVKISWSSSNPEVAEIVENTGELTAISPGKTVIQMEDRANGVVKSFSLTVKWMPVLPEIPEEWYDVEDMGLGYQWQKTCPEDALGDTYYSQELVHGVRIVLKDEYYNLFRQCSMLRIPEKIDGKEVWSIKSKRSGWYGAIHEFGFRNLKMLQAPDIIGCITRWDDTVLEEIIYPSDTYCLKKYYPTRKRLHIPESTVMLMDNAIQVLDIRQLRVPAGVKMIHSECFEAGDYSTVWDRRPFCVDGNNTNYYSIFGVLFSYPIYAKEKNEDEGYWIKVSLYPNSVESDIGKNILLIYPAEKTASTYCVPDGVEVIARNAFYNAKFLKKIILPDSVTVLGENAFAGIGHDVEIVIPTSVTLFMDDGWGGPFGIYPPEDENDEDYSYPGIEWDHITIVTPKGSAAEAYAIEHGIKYRNE